MPLIPSDRELRLGILAEHLEELGDAITNHLGAHFRLFGKRAEQIRNEVLGDVWLQVGGGECDTVTAEDLQRMARNKLLYELKEECKQLERRHEYAVKHGESLRVSEPERPNAAVEQHELLAVVERAVGKLTEHQRQCWILANLDGLSVDDIAERLGLARDTVRKYAHQAQEMVEQELGRYDRNAEQGTKYRGFH